jgi:hypothetical protein
MALSFSNFGSATIASAPSGTSGLSFSVTAGQGARFPTLGVSDYFYGIFKDAAGNREIVKISGRSTDAMTIAASGRGLDGTTARTWLAGDYFVLGVTNIALQEYFNANVSALGGVTSAADKVPYFTGSGTASVADITSYARTLLAVADATAARAALGIVAATEVIPAGSVTVWFQASAPTGWTQVTTQNNKALRVVSSAGAGTGGSVGFTSAFAAQGISGSVGNTTLTTAQIPAHTHTYKDTNNAGTPTGGTYYTGSIGDITTETSSSTGGGGSHNHTFTGTSINLAVQYIDLILASKN